MELQLEATAFPSNLGKTAVISLAQFTGDSQMSTTKRQGSQMKPSIWMKQIGRRLLSEPWSLGEALASDRQEY